MRKYWGLVLALLLITSCNQKKIDKIEQATELNEIKPIEKKFGFNFDAYTIIQDTIKKGDSFGQLMLKNNADYKKVITVSEKYKDTFDIRKIRIGKPYFILKSKDSLEKAQVLIYQNNKIDYTVFDLKDSVRVYTVSYTHLTLPTICSV